MKLLRENGWIYAPCKDPVMVDDSMMNLLREQAIQSPTGSSRLLLHRDPAQSLHEMLIVHKRGFYIRPHINSNSAKSYTLIDGEMIVAWFSGNGTMLGHSSLGSMKKFGNKLIRFDKPVFHTLLPITETVVFIETILGPHLETIYADWAPSKDATDASSFYEKLKGDLRLI